MILMMCQTPVMQYHETRFYLPKHLPCVIKNISFICDVYLPQLFPEWVFDFLIFSFPGLSAFSGWGSHRGKDTALLSVILNSLCVRWGRYPEATKKHQRPASWSGNMHRNTKQSLQSSQTLLYLVPNEALWRCCCETYWEVFSQNLGKHGQNLERAVCG